VTPPLFLLDPLPAGDDVVLDGDEGRHARVRRIRVGELVLVGDGRGGLLHCEVRRLLHDGVLLSVLSRRQVAPSSPRLVVVQALPKGDRADLAVELLTELGADEIVPWASSRAVTRWEPARADKAIARWRRTARESAKQSRRAWIPDVSELATTDAVSQRLKAAATGLVLGEDAKLGLASVELAGAGDIAIVVGPEGGISSEELDRFVDAGAAVVRLGDPVLRTSTAGGAALAALNLRLGRWA
jgi:16S rRNA (uracil1498-N3)-methyltransferase